MHLKINKSYKCEVTWLDFSPFLGRVTIKEKRAFISPKSMSHSQRHTVFDKYCGQWPEVKTWINTNNECYDCAERNLKKKAFYKNTAFPANWVASHTNQIKTSLISEKREVVMFALAITVCSPAELSAPISTFAPQQLMMPARFCDQKNSENFKFLRNYVSSSLTSWMR